MDEPVKVKYVPFDKVLEIINNHYWLGDGLANDLYQMVEKYGIDTVEYKCNRIIFGKDQNDEQITGKWELPKVSYHDWEEDRR